MDTSTVVIIGIAIIVTLICVYGEWVKAGRIIRIDDNLKKLTADKQAAATPPETPDATAAQAPAPTPPDTDAAPPVANVNSPEANTNSPDTNSAPPAGSALDAYLAQWAKKPK